MPKTSQQRARSKPSHLPASGLLNALNFVKRASDDKGEVYQKHAFITGKQVVAFNGTISSGHPIEEDLVCCPHISTLITALSKCGEQLSITHLNNNRLSVVSGKFRANINCVGMSDLRYAEPDPNITPIGKEIVEGFEAIGHIVSETIGRVHESALLLQSCTMVATSGKVLAEYWHGYDLPSNLLLPRAFIDNVIANKETPSGFGFSNSSVTFHYADNSWIKTLRFDGQYSNYGRIFEQSNKDVHPVPDDFWPAFDTIFPFCEDGRLYLKAGKLQTHDSENEGAMCDCFGMGDYGIINAKNMKQLRPVMNQVDFASSPVYFQGEKTRGCFTKFTT